MLFGRNPARYNGKTTVDDSTAKNAGPMARGVRASCVPPDRPTPNRQPNGPVPAGTAPARPGARMSGVTGSSAHDPGAKLTYDDLVGKPDDGLRRELIDGELYVTPSPS